MAIIECNNDFIWERSDENNNGRCWRYSFSQGT